MFKRVYLISYTYQCFDRSWGLCDKTYELYRKLNKHDIDYIRNDIKQKQNRIVIDRNNRSNHYKDVVILNIVKL